MITFNYDLLKHTEDEFIMTRKIKIPQSFILVNQKAIIKSNYLNKDPLLRTIKMPSVLNALKLAEIIINCKNDLLNEPEYYINKLFYLKEKLEKISRYLEANIDYLKVFFIEENEEITLYSLLDNDIKTIVDLMESIDMHSDRALLELLLKNLYPDKQNVPIDFVLESKKNFILYMQGAGYNYNVKEELCRLYFYSSLYPNQSFIKEKLKNFVSMYYAFYLLILNNS